MTHLGPSLRREKVRERPGVRLATASLASLALNALILALLVRAGAFRMAAPGDVKRVTLAPLSASQWAANRAVRPSPTERKAQPFAMPRPPPPEPEAKRDEKGQVVDLGPTNERKPKDARFLSDRDSSVEKETRSRHAKAGYARALPTPSAPGAQAAAPAGEKGKSDRAVPGLEGPAAAQRAADRKVAAAPPSSEGELPGGAAAREGLAPAPAPGAGEGGERRRGEKTDPLIAPGTLARVAGGPAPDHLDGVEEGEGTFLNAREWKYATYMNRIKQAVAAKWDPDTPLASRDPDGTIFGRRDRTTAVDVTLDDTGHLKAISIVQKSGLEFLDRAATTAFKNAEPFLNPPRGMIDQHGEIKFVFGFILTFDRSAVRVFRAPVPVQ